MFKSLANSYNNLKKGNWNALSKEEIDELINHQISSLDANEEQMTPDEIEKVKSTINEMIDMTKKINPDVQIDFK